MSSIALALVPLPATVEVEVRLLPMSCGCHINRPTATNRVRLRMLQPAGFAEGGETKLKRTGVPL